MKRILTVEFPDPPTSVIHTEPSAKVIDMIVVGTPGPPGPSSEGPEPTIDYVLLYDNAIA